MPTSVVTGGAGFLGSNLCDALLERGHRVICVDNLETGSLHNVEHNRGDQFLFLNHAAEEDVRERLAAVEAVGAAGDDVDPRLGLAPGRPRHLVVQPLLDGDLDPTERVDEVGEAEQIDERVVVDPEPEQARDRLFQVPRSRLAAA